MNELEVKLTQTQNKEVETYEYLQLQVDMFKKRLDEDKTRHDGLDVQLMSELESFEHQVGV